MRHHEAGFEAETIEGDDVYLEATHATAVRGRRVVIGPGCVIQEVEYSETLQIDPSAQVERTTFTGEGAASEVERVAAPRPEGWAREQGGRACGGLWRVNFGEREIRNPVARAIAAVIGLLIAGAVVSGVVFLVLPAVGFVVAVVLGGVAALLLVIFLALPLLILGAAVAEGWRRRGR